MVKETPNLLILTIWINTVKKNVEVVLEIGSQIKSCWIIGVELWSIVNS